MRLKRGDLVRVEWRDSTINGLDHYTDADVDGLHVMTGVSVGQVASVHKESITLALTQFLADEDNDRQWRQVTTIPRFAIRSIVVLRGP